jgi:hypothetical protein
LASDCEIRSNLALLPEKVDQEEAALRNTLAGVAYPGMKRPEKPKFGLADLLASASAARLAMSSLA